MEAALLTEAQKDAAKHVLSSGSEVRGVTICELGEHHVQPPLPVLKERPMQWTPATFLGSKRTGA